MVKCELLAAKLMKEPFEYESFPLGRFIGENEAKMDDYPSQLLLRHILLGHTTQRQ